MSFNDHLIHLCTIKRSAGDSTDSFGEDDSLENVVAANVPCRFVDKTERAAKPSLGEMLAGSYLLLLPEDTDVQRGDQVSEIKDKVDGSVIDNRAFTVEGALTRRGKIVHHKSVRLEVVA